MDLGRRIAPVAELCYTQQLYYIACLAITKHISKPLTPLHHFEMFPEDVAQERRRLGHESLASHIAQVSALTGVQRSVAARRRHQFVVRLVVVVQVLVRIVVVVVVAAPRRLAATVAVAAAAETAAAAADALPDHLTAAAHDRGVGTGRGELLELRCAAHYAAQ